METKKYQPSAEFMECFAAPFSLSLSRAGCVLPGKSVLIAAMFCLLPSRQGARAPVI